MESIENDIWEWQEGDDCCLKERPSDMSRCLWDEVNQNEDSLIYLLEEQTPIKDCADFRVYQTPDIEENINKLEECRDSLQLKRRRVLHFPHDSNETSFCDVQPASVFIRSKEREDEQIDDRPSSPSTNAELNLQWDGSCAFISEVWDQPSEGWLNECLDSSMLHCKLDEASDPILDLNCNETCINEEDQITELCGFSSDIETESKKEPRHSSSSSLSILLKSRKAIMETSTKLTTSVAYPFALVKPCGDEGGLTLKDINQKLHMPLSSRTKLVEDENSSSSYPTSAFSGKPVVVKTKIRTEGGKGSITIMRTKG